MAGYDSRRGGRYRLRLGPPQSLDVSQNAGALERGAPHDLAFAEPASPEKRDRR
jgi:hypothetical protein